MLQAALKAYAAVERLWLIDQPSRVKHTYLCKCFPGTDAKMVNAALSASKNSVDQATVVRSLFMVQTCLYPVNGSLVMAAASCVAVTLLSVLCCILIITLSRWLRFLMSAQSLRHSVRSGAFCCIWQRACAKQLSRGCMLLACRLWRGRD